MLPHSFCTCCKAHQHQPEKSALNSKLVSTNATKVNKGDFHNVTFRKYSNEDVALWIYLSNTDLLAIRFYSGGVSMSRSVNGGDSWNTIF